ncbi:LuxR family transcriptional regulator [Mycobacterium eburneum]|nr:LuxR family transcriptional regulator [Mycobacterium eburneum]TDH57154.1 LuxR family transcriptional regulator [Mycobacterium eburneum]
MVGRDTEVHQALAAFDDSTDYRGVVLVGEAGVGKSTLAHSLAETLESRGFTLRFALGTETGSAVPLGAFYWLMTLDAAQEPAVMLATAQRTLEQEENLVVMVDDAQLLDPLSASLLYQLAAGGIGRLIVTIRSGNMVPDAVTALWKEWLLRRLEVKAFTPQQTEDLVRAVLGGAVDARLINELHRRTAGNVLLLRGLLSAGRDSGVLVQTRTGWQLRAPLRPDRQLSDLLEFRLRSLTAEELDAVEIVAAAEVLDWETLRGLCDADAVAKLERRGLIQLVADESHTVARLLHPVMGETAIQHAGVVRTRQLNGMLAQHLRKQMQALEQQSRVPDVRTRIQLAQFMMRSDLAPDLGVITEAASCALTMANTASSEELGRFAFEHGGGLPAALVLASALSWQGRGDEAEAVLAEADPEGSDAALTAQWGCLRAANLFFNCGQVDSARRQLVDVRERVGAQPMVQLTTALDVLFAFFSGDLEMAIETGPSLCTAEVLPLATVWAAAPTAYGLGLVGRFDEVRAVADAGLRAAALSESGPQRFAIGVAEAVAAMAAGDYREAERVWERYSAMAAGIPAGDAMVAAIRGLVELAGGALRPASAAFHDSISALSDGFPSLWTMLTAAWCTQAEGMRGDAAAAAATLRIAEQSYGPQAAVLLPELELARAWERAAAGHTTAARTHAQRAAQIAQQSGMPALEVGALHAAVRLGDRSCAARLEELAAVLGTPLAAGMAGHARGLAGHDGDLLDAAADGFVEVGALALAADAAAQAAAEHARGGHRGKEIGSSTRADRLAGRCGLRTPATVAAARPLPITEREREIATLVASGWSNRQIADRLIVSVRTIDGHLYRIFAKLGINTREQLIDLLKPDHPS